MVRELELRSIPAATQQLVRIQYKGIVFDEPLRFDILVDSCLLLELKAVEALHPFSKAQLFSYMKVVDVPVGLLINFHEPVLRNGISRLISCREQIKWKEAKITKSLFECARAFSATCAPNT
jgi:GxxExxY protein